MLKHRPATIGIFILLLVSSVTAPRMLINEPSRSINAASMLPTLQPAVSVPTPEALAPTTTTLPRASRGTERRHAVVSTPTTVRRAPAPAQAVSGDFWWKLANCESEVGRTSPNIFQLVGHGYRAGMTYDQQLALAQAWAVKIHPREGTTEGWPVCWWRALRG